MSGTFQFRPAKREGVHLIVGLMGGTGSGKTYSALRLASGLAGGGKVAVIDTEAGRAQHYADAFRFDHGDLKPPFAPGAYLAAIEAAAEAGYPVIVVDSMSHEHAGEGGLLDWHEAEFQRLGARDAVKMTAWIKPKMAHKAMVARLLQLRAHLILCFRAEPKVRMEKDGNGKVQIIDAGYQSIAAKGLEFELTASFLLSHERPGLPDHPLKLPAALRAAFPAGKPIDEEAGKTVAAWAAGTSTTEPAAPANGEACRAFADAIRATAAPSELLTVIGRDRGRWGALAAADKAALWAVLDEAAKRLDFASARDACSTADACDRDAGAGS